MVTEQNFYEGSPGLWQPLLTKLHAPFTDCGGGEVGPCWSTPSVGGADSE